MFKKESKRLLGISAAMMLILPVIPFVQPTQVQAVSDTFTLTSVGNDTINVTMNGTASVLMPDGTIVTANTPFKVKENRTYTFVGIDGEMKTQKSITMTNVPNAPALLVVAPGEKTKIKFESADPHSGIQDMRYKVYDEAAGEASQPFTTWEPLQASKDYTIPSITANTSRTWVVKAEFRDVAGNVATNIVNRFLIENWKPNVNISQTAKFVNSTNVNVRAVGFSKYAPVSQARLGLSSTNLDKTYETNTLQNLFNGANGVDEYNYIYDLPYTIPDKEGSHTLYVEMSKKQNSQTLTSDMASTSLVYDKTAPTGTAVINNGEDTLPSRDTTLTINTADNLSGVEKIKIVEEGTGKEVTITNPPAKFVRDWTFDMDVTGRIVVIVTDKAGNESTIYSQKVTFAKLNINSVDLTQNRNPIKYNNKNPFVRKSSWNALEEQMLSGSNFEFAVGYDMGVGNTADYTITGEYIMSIEKDGKISYQTVMTPFNSSTGSTFNSGKVNIPENMPEGADVFVTANLKAVNKQKPGLVLTETTGKKLFGKIGKGNLNDVVNGAIQFNEVN